MDVKLEQLFTDFVRDNKKQLYLFAYSYVKNEQDALDIIQDSIQKAWLSLHTLEKKAQMKSWLFQIIARTAIDFLRKMKRIQVMDDEKLKYLSPQQQDTYEDVDLENAMDHLPLPLREVIILRYFEDLKLEDVAIILNIPLSTAKSRLYKALKLLKIELSDEGSKEYG
ncbi:RNA polymerase subunit sigma-70 [Solibacillus sp. R5-41]|uniref:RNA polymerase sigma factor n=1 Tax=Solibacillus sp. R5-41 TaxID=2048654 RepID=UPI000C127143|nr:RNA polymerase sigma factor [Solibacillus sp. R5-41]ATP40462.1 RNA polymerase subunit sigma-70 [Solibacillus sp. R5-41]